MSCRTRARVSNNQHHDYGEVSFSQPHGPSAARADRIGNCELGVVVVSAPTMNQHHTES